MMNVKRLLPIESSAIVERSVFRRPSNPGDQSRGDTVLLVQGTQYVIRRLIQGLLFTAALTSD
jgi:hypothetical protein